MQLLLIDAIILAIKCTAGSIDIKASQHLCRRLIQPKNDLDGSVRVLSYKKCEFKVNTKPKQEVNQQ
jgi:hypothetical protein